MKILTIDSILEKAKIVLSEIENKLTDQKPVEDEKPVEEVKFMDAKTSDGQIIRCDMADFVVGAKVQIINEDGTTSDIPDGDYTLEDGRTLTIQGSVVITITPEETEPAETAQPDAENPAESEMQTKLSEKDLEISNLKMEIEKLKVEIGNITKEKTTLSSKVEELGKEPAAKPFKKSDKVEVTETKLRASEMLNQIIGKK